MADNKNQGSPIHEFCPHRHIMKLGDLSLMCRDCGSTNVVCPHTVGIKRDGEWFCELCGEEFYADQEANPTGKPGLSPRQISDLLGASRVEILDVLSDPLSLMLFGFGHHHISESKKKEKTNGQ